MGLASLCPQHQLVEVSAGHAQRYSNTVKKTLHPLHHHRRSLLRCCRAHGNASCGSQVRLAADWSMVELVVAVSLVFLFGKKQKIRQSGASRHCVGGWEARSEREAYRRATQCRHGCCPRSRSTSQERTGSNLSPEIHDDCLIEMDDGGGMKFMVRKCASVNVQLAFTFVISGASQAWHLHMQELNREAGI